MSGMTHGEYMRALRDGKATEAHEKVKPKPKKKKRTEDD